MMRSIIRSSMQFRYLVMVVVSVMMLYGFSQLRDMPVDTLPEFSPTVVEIQTEALGLSAREVEQMITIPMEQNMLAGVAWLDVIRSESVPGLSSILIYFEPDTDLYRARQMVSERLAQAAVGIPNVSKPPMMIQPTSSASRFMIVGLSSEKLSLIEMSVLARWTIGPRLMSVPGVANVAIWGNRDRQLQVLVNPERLEAYHVTLQEVVATTGNALWVSPLSFLQASSPGTGGFIDTPNQRLGIWHVLPISSPAELARVPIVNSTTLTLGDVTQIVENHQPLIGDAVVNDKPNLLLVIEKLPGTNALEVTRGVEEAIDNLRPGFADIRFDSSLYRPATFIETARASLARSLVISAMIAVLVLGLLFYGWRATLISLLVIPVSLMVALLVLHRAGSTFNALVLAGLVASLGILVDEAVVDTQHIAQRLRRNREQPFPRPADVVILDAAAEIRGPLFFATLAAVLAILPVFFVAGVSGSLFRPLAVSYALSIGSALAVALILAPALCLALLPGAHAAARESWLTSALQRVYGRLIEKSLLKPAGVLIGALLLGILALAALPFLRSAALLPTFREPYKVVRFDGASGTSLQEMDRIAARASSEIRAIPGVRNVAAHVGRAISGDQVVGINSAELWVSIDPSANYDATSAAIEEAAYGYPGLGSHVRTYLEERLGQPRLTGGADKFTVRLFGDDYRALTTEVDKLRQVIAGVSGVQDAHALFPVEEPTIELEADLQAAQHYGIKPGDVRRAAAILLSGLQVGSLFEQQKVFDVMVWSSPEIRRNLTDMQNLLIDTPGGGHVRLADVASVRVTSAPAVIRHEGLSAYMDIGFTVRGRSVGAVMRDVRGALAAYPFAPEQYAQVQADYAEEQAARLAILIASVLAAIGIFLLMQAVSGSWRLALAAFAALPVALSGGVFAAILTGSALSLAALFGLFTVLGLAVRHSTALAGKFGSDYEGDQPFGAELIARWAHERSVPLVISTLTLGLVLLPFALAGNRAGYEVVGPMAIVMLGGLITTAFYSLLVMPVLCLRFGAAREPDLRLVPSPAD